MIKVNLLRNLGGTAVQVAGTYSESTGISATMSGDDLQKQAVFKLIVVALCVGALIFYEKTQLAAKRDLVSQSQAQLSQVQAEIQKYGDAAPMVEKYNKEKTKLDQQIKVLENLTANRLREVKLLDAIQSVMPNKAWLESIEVIQGKGKMIGYADTDDTATAIYQQLQSNVLFKLEAPTTGPATDPDLGEVKKFEVPFTTGKMVP